MAALLFVSVLWAFSFGLIRHYLVSLDSSVVAMARLALGCLVFAPWLRLSSLTRRACLWLMGIGAVQFGIMYILYIESFHYLHAYQVAVLTLSTPLFVCLFDAALERRFSWLFLLAALLAAVGALIVVGSQPLGHAEYKGVLLIQASNAAFALGQLLYRRFRLRHDPFTDLRLMPWLYLGAVAMAIPFAASRVRAASIAFTPTQALVIAYLGIVASGIGFFLFNLGSARVNAGTLAVMNNAKIPLGVAASLLVFGETADPFRLVLGSVVVVLAVLVAKHDTARRFGVP